MPTYAYQCLNCQYQFEELQKITDSPLDLCLQCKLRKLQRLPSAGIGLNFTGSGYYITDYKKKDSKVESKS